MKNCQILTLFGAALILLSCGPSNQKSMKPSPSGAPGDLILVMNEKYWNGASGDSIREILASPVEALPQDEPQFTVYQIGHRVFDKNFKTQRNIVVVKVGSDQHNSGVRVQRGLWAKGQILVSIHARNNAELIELLSSHRDEILSLLLNAERSRLIDAYEATMDKKVVDKLKQKDILLSAPKGYIVDVFEDDFIWLAMEYRDIIQGIFIYFYPYTDENTFSPEYLVAKRNSFLKKYVPGEIEGSYMSTEDLFPPLFREYNLRNEKYTAEMKGLWRMEKGLAMGGPFLSITQLDKTRNRIVTADAFVFAPAHKKRELLRQLEAIILTLEFPEEPDQGEEKL